MLSPAYAASHVMQANDCARTLCALHERLGLCATWAVVGAAIDQSIPVRDRFASVVDEAEERIRFNSYLISVGDCEGLFDIPVDILESIQKSDVLEFGCHTYAHRYVDRIREEVLAKDLARFNEVCKLACRSIVFPRNVVDHAALVAAKDAGFQVVRINPRKALYMAVKGTGLKSLIIRILRYADAFLPIQEMLPSKPSTNHLKGLYITEGQYFFRPDCGFPLLDVIHRVRLMFGLWACRKRKIDAHLWTHPHNFGANPIRSLSNAEKLFTYITSILSPSLCQSAAMDSLVTKDRSGHSKQ